MKHAITSPKFTSEQIEEMIDAVPEQVNDPLDCPYDPNDEAAVKAFWENGVAVKGGRPEAVRAASAEKRKLG